MADEWLQSRVYCCRHGCFRIPMSTGYLLCYSQGQLKTRPLRAVWAPIRDGAEIKAFMTVRKGPLVHSSRRVSLPEVLALQNIYYRAKEFGAKVGIIVDSKKSEIQRDCHIILLGGPTDNEAAKWAWSYVTSRIPYTISEDMKSISTATHHFDPLIGMMVIGSMTLRWWPS